MDEHLREQLERIPALASFLQEPEGEEEGQVPTGTLACRIRDLLAQVSQSPRWYKAGMLPYALPKDSATVFVVAVPMPEIDALSIKVVVEDETGGLHVAADLPPADDMLAGIALTSEDKEEASTQQHIADLSACFSRIIQALIETSNLLKSSAQISQEHKKWLRYELAHACKHLSLYLEELKKKGT